MKEKFVTKDLPLAALLRTKGVDLMECYNKDTKEWCFTNPDECEKLFLDMTNGKALVDVLEYEKHRKNLLGMTHYGKTR